MTITTNPMPTITRVRRLAAALGVGATLLAGAAGLAAGPASAQAEPDTPCTAAVCPPSADGADSTDGPCILGGPDCRPPDGDDEVDLLDLTTNPDDPDGDDGEDDLTTNPDDPDGDDGSDGRGDDGHIPTPERIDTGAGGAARPVSAIPGLAVLGGSALGLATVAGRRVVRNARAFSGENR